MPEPPAIQLAKTRRERRRVPLPPLGVPPSPVARGPLAMGCLFMLVATGVWVLFFFVSPTHPAEPFPGARKWGATVFAAVFFLFGLRAALEGVSTPRWWALRRFRGGREPWGEGYRWRRESRPLPQWKAEKRGWLKGCIGLVAIAVFGLLINMIWLDPSALSGDVWLAYLLIPLFTLFILFLLGAGAWEIVRQLTFGLPAITFETYPARPGETLRVVVDHRGRFRKSPSVKLTLACLDQGAPDLGKGSAKLDALFVLEQELSLEPGRRFAASFALPADAPPTNLDQPNGARRYWLLEVAAWQGKLRETESYSFLVPVYAG